MKNQQLKALLSSLASEAATGEFENLTAEYADKIRGGLGSSNGTCNNGTCGGSSNGSCSNGSCGSSNNGSCPNGKSFY